jgi:hypothetical protein
MWPSETVRFVDFDNGAVGNQGLKPSNAYKYLDTAISDAAHGDVIYIRPRSPELGAAGVGPYYGGDPGDITPQTASTNWTIAYTKYGLSLIGTGTGIGVAGAQQTTLQGDATITSTPVFTVNAPYVTFENFGIKPGASTTGLIKQSFTNDAADQAWANSYYKIWFRNVDGQAASYSLLIDAGSYDNVIGCNFSGHKIGIRLDSINSNVNRIIVRDCDFETATTTAKAHIYSTGAITRVLFDKLTMMGTIPAGGSPNLYISIAAASTGMWSDSYIGAASSQDSTNTTLNGITYSHIYCGIQKGLLAGS